MPRPFNSTTTPNHTQAKTPHLRRVLRIAERDGGVMCHYCGRSLIAYSYHEPNHPDIACIDHVVPRSKGGSNRLDNLVLACRVCNSRKKTRTYTEFMGGAS